MSSQWQIESLATSTRHSLKLRVDASTEISFKLLTGQARTPLALIMAGIHGDEYEGPAAILNLADEIDLGTMLGSVLFVLYRLRIPQRLRPQPGVIHRIEAISIAPFRAILQVLQL